MHYYEKEVVCALLDMGGCIRLMRDVLIDYSAGRTIQTLRSVLPVSERKLLGLMPAANTAAGIMGVKAITVFPDNFQRGLPSHQGVVLLFDLDTGMLKALLDGDAITGVRTAAVSAAATDALARKDAHTLCILGSGLQARRHLEAIHLVREIREVRVWDIVPESVRRYKAEMEAKFGIPVVDCTALDVTIQAQVLELMKDLKEKYDTSMIMITHDLGIVSEVCDKVAIIYAGEVVEYGSLEHIYRNPQHPYTNGLFGSLPDISKDVEFLSPIEGLMPDPAALPTGCKFNPRCKYACPLCAERAPVLTETEPGHFVRCLIYENALDVKEVVKYE